jgi:hypothetical protein
VGIPGPPPPLPGPPRAAAGPEPPKPPLVPVVREQSSRGPAAREQSPLVPAVKEQQAPVPEPPQPPPAPIGPEPPEPPPTRSGAERPESPAAPSARRGPQIDLSALLRRTTAADALVAGGLFLLLVFSFVGGWIQTSYTCPSGDIYCAGSTSSAVGSLWEGFGVLPALVVVFAIGWFIAVKIPGLHLHGIVPDSPIWRAPWMGFAGLKVVLFLIYWPIQGGTYSSLGSTTPGWALWASIAFAAVVGIGGYLEHRGSVGTAGGVATASAAGAALTRGAQGGYVSPLPGGGQFPAAGTGKFPPAGVGQFQAAGEGQLPAAGVGQVSPAGANEVTPPPAPPVLAVGTLSADRSEWFDGTRWQDASLSAPPRALRSPDGNQWWDGTTWRAIPGWHVRAQGTGMVRPVPRASYPASGAHTGGAGVEHQGGAEAEHSGDGPEQPPAADALHPGAPAG